MNNIEIRKVHKVGNWYDFEWFVDGIRLSKYLIDRKNIELPHKVEPFDGAGKACGIIFLHTDTIEQMNYFCEHIEESIIVKLEDNILRGGYEDIVKFM